MVRNIGVCYTNTQEGAHMLKIRLDIEYINYEKCSENLIPQLVEEMKSKTNTSELEKLFKRTNNMKMYVDLENWKYYNLNPDEMIETTESLVTNKLSLSDLDLIILNTIKHEKPRSIRDLAKKINKDVSNIQPKVKKLEEDGFIKFEDGIKNSKIPYLTFDEIKLEI